MINIIGRRGVSNTLRHRFYEYHPALVLRASRMFSSSSETAAVAAAKLKKADANQVIQEMEKADAHRYFEALIRSEHGCALFSAADTNKDGDVSKIEFLRWRTMLTKSGSTASTAPAASAKQLAAMSLRYAIPMVGFGFADNFIMITAGEQIDIFFGAAFAISTMAAAGFGNTLSDVAGIGLSGIIERASEKMGLPDPCLTAAQKSSRSVKLIAVLASALGIAVGCILGMVPLYFMGGKSGEQKHGEKATSQTLDAGGDNQISKKEMSRAVQILRDMHHCDSIDFDAADFIKKYDVDGSGPHSFQEFSAMADKFCERGDSAKCDNC